MGSSAGRRLALSLPRRFITDLVHFAQKVPTVPVQRRMALPALVEARRLANPRPSWTALFVKAYALVARQRPELRRAFLSFPWPHLYEHGCSVASVAIERRMGDEDAVLFGKIRYPEERSLAELDALLQELREAPIERIAAFRRAIWLARWPLPIRRLLWWASLNLFGSKRAHYMGTFGISVYAALGAASLHPLSPLTSTLNYGVLDEDGSLDVRVIYDHRVMDGATVARTLADLEQALLGSVLMELRQMAKAQAA